MQIGLHLWCLVKYCEKNDYLCKIWEIIWEWFKEFCLWGNKMEYSNISYIFSESLEYLFTWTVIMFQCIYHPSQHTHQCQTSCCITLRKESDVFSCSQIGTAACTSVPGCVLWTVPSAWGTEGIERIHGGCTMAAVKCHLWCSSATLFVHVCVSWRIACLPRPTHIKLAWSFCCCIVVA